MSLSEHSPTITPEQSEDFQESSEDSAQADAELEVQERAQEQAGDRKKKRTTVTHEIVTRFLEEYNQSDRGTIKSIAEKVGISYTTAKKLLREIRRGDHDCEDMILYRPTMKGRKSVQPDQNCRRVKEVLTQSTTVTLGKAKEVLEAEDIHMSRATISRIANDKNLSDKKTASKAGVVFPAESVDQRHEYAVQVDGIPNDRVWFLDETGFNLHTAPLRAWSERGKTPVQPVPANRQKNLSVLMCIGVDGVKFHERRDGAFTAKSFLASIKLWPGVSPKSVMGKSLLSWTTRRSTKRGVSWTTWTGRASTSSSCPHTHQISIRLRMSSSFSSLSTSAWGFRRRGLRRLIRSPALLTIWTLTCSRSIVVCGHSFRKR